MMNTTRNRLLLLLLLMLCGHDLISQNCKLRQISRHVMHGTISGAVEYLSLSEGQFHPVQEPFMVLRGIRGCRDSLMFIIYCDRTTGSLFADPGGNFNSDSVQINNYALIKDQKVRGLSLRCGSRVLTRGRTIPWFDFQE